MQSVNIRHSYAFLFVFYFLFFLFNEFVWKGFFSVNNIYKIECNNEKHCTQSQRRPKFFWISAMAPLTSVILGSLLVYLTHAEKHGVQVVSISLSLSLSLSVETRHTDIHALSDGDAKTVQLATGCGPPPPLQVWVDPAFAPSHMCLGLLASSQTLGQLKFKILSF